MHSLNNQGRFFLRKSTLCWFKDAGEHIQKISTFCFLSTYQNFPVPLEAVTAEGQLNLDNYRVSVVDTGHGPAAFGIKFEPRGTGLQALKKKVDTPFFFLFQLDASGACRLRERVKSK